MGDGGAVLPPVSGHPAELGGRLAVSRQAVNEIETGRHDPSLPLAFRIARLFGLPIAEIFIDAPDDASP
ncbi:MAG: helix-turn-helix transcriptional regulator [Nitrospiraceae bacterium]|nr:helix-turn-helix transcriptional regulator [Nitrospiraceae bacterium]